jgi:intracellular septation protein
MQMFYEILPVFLFFLAFKFFDIYVATIVGIVATTAQVLLTRLITGKWDRKQVITMAIFVVFGSMTLYFHNPIFVKWKPTIIFWIFSVVIIGAHLFTNKTIMQRMMEEALQDMVVPVKAWRKISWLWAFSFMILGTINLYVAYYLSDNAWVNFKFYGITGALLVISIVQAVYLVRFMSKKLPTA